MASNERLLNFGLGDASGVTELRVNWPSGATTRLADLACDVTIELIEGSTRGVLWRSAVPESFTVPSSSQ